MNVLLIEDNPDDIDLIKRMIRLANAGQSISLESASTLAEGLACLERDEIHVALLDLGLPDSVGLETLSTLQQRAPGLPVVVQTGFADEQLGMEAVRQGAQDYLTKGEIDIQLLLRTLRYAIERNRIEMELRRHRIDLERLVAERTADLQHTNDLLQQEIAERERVEKRALDLAVEQERARVLTSFVQAASHDFRTPLSTINTSLYLIRRLDDPAEHEEQLDIIELQTARLAKLVDGMLKLLQLEAGTAYDFRPANFNTLIEHVQTYVKVRARVKHVEIVPMLASTLPPIQADVTELEHALTELVDNAIRYSPASGQVLIRTRADGAGVELVIEDRGIGISADDLPYVFELLYRADKARSSETGGPGLGLPIAQKIILAHHGTIDISSTAGAGTVVRVWLPCAS